MRNRKHDIERYLRGELSSAEMHSLEKEALTDPFLAEALEGVEQAGADNFLYDLHKLNRSVHDRMRKRSRKKNKVIRMWGWTTAVAATILLVAVSGFLVINILREHRAKEQSDAGKPATLPDSANTATADSLPVTDESGPLAALDDHRESTKESPSSLPVPARKDDVQRADARENTAIERAAGKEVSPADQPPSGETAGEKRTDAEAERDQPALTKQAGRKEGGAEERTRASEPVAESLDGRVAGLDVKKSASPAAKSRALTTSVIRGRVSDETGAELPGVNVAIQGTNTGTVTDGEGRYEIVVPEGAKLVFGFIGFESREITVDGKPELNVTLEEDISALSEVVVTSYGTSGQPSEAPASFRSAEPDGGRTDFKSYLASTIKYPGQAIKNKTEGKVTIRFTVEPTGQLTDFEVVKGIGNGCEEELIRAIQQGPYWKPSTQGDQPVRDKVRVRYRFALPK